MIVRDEILFAIERRFQKLLYLILAVFIVIAVLFLIFIGRFDSNPLKLQQEIRNTIELKLSANDLVELFNAGAAEKWCNVGLIQKNRAVSPIKIRHVTEYSFDFELNIDGIRYNLYSLGSAGKALYNFFKTASYWGLESSVPQLVQLKINNVLIGIYIIEERIYEQIREENGQYFLRLGNDVLLLHRILYQVQSRTSEPLILLERYFDTQKLASYIVFFSLFCYDDVLDLDRLTFRYDPIIKKFVPYLTMESVILSFQEQGKRFKPFPADHSFYNNRLTHRNITALLSRANAYKYGPLIIKVLENAKLHLPGRKKQ